MAAKRNRLISILTRSIVIVVALAMAIGIFVVLRITRPIPAGAEDVAAAPGVMVMRARPVQVQRQWDGFGTARAMDSADVPARVSATVVEVPASIEPGAQVEQGELIARLDDSDFQRQVEITTQTIADIDSQVQRLDLELTSWTERAKLAGELVQLEQAEFDRVIEAMRRGAAKQREVDIARQALIDVVRSEIGAREELDKLTPRRASLNAQHLAQEASLRLARQNVERCTIASPLDGYIQIVDIDVGESLRSGERVARVVNLERIEVPLLLPAAARGTVRLGDEATLRTTADPAQIWTASISRISPEDDAATRTMAVFVELTQDPGDPMILVPGRFVRGSILSRNAPTRWVMPRRAVQGGRLLLIEDGRVSSRPITVDFHTEGIFPQLGVDDRQWVVLHDPLPEGSLVVVNPSRSLVIGGPARPVVAEMAGTPATDPGAGP